MSKWKRFFVVADTHGSFIHWPDAEKMLRHKAEWKPHVTIHLGDFHDATALRVGADETDQASNYGEDWSEAVKFLKLLRPNVCMVGNHDARLWHLANSPRTVVREFARKCIGDVEHVFSGLRCDLLPYTVRGGIYQLGRLKLMHGFHAGESAEKNAAQQFGFSVIGHVHRSQSWKPIRDDGARCWSCGYLANSDLMHYCDHYPSTLRWVRSWIYGVWNERTGEFVLWQAQKVKDEYVVSEGATWL